MNKTTATESGWLPEFMALGAIWGSSFMFMRLASVEFGPLPTAALRVAIAFAFLLPFVWWRGQLGNLYKLRHKVLLVGMLNSGIPFACYSFALLHIGTGLSAILNATVPLFGALIAWAWLKDRPTRSRMLGLVIGFVGVAMLASDQTSFRSDAVGLKPILAVLACLLATFCYGLAASYTKKHLQGIPPLVTAAGSQLGATLGLALPAFIWPPLAWPSTTAWSALIAVGILCTGVAYILYFRLIEHAGPAKALTVTFVVPVFAIGYGVIVLGEPLTVSMVGWGAVVLVGTSLSSGLVAFKRRP